MTPSEWFGNGLGTVISWGLVISVLAAIGSIIFFIFRYFVVLSKRNLNWFGLLNAVLIFALFALTLQYGPPTFMRSAQRGIRNSLPYASAILGDVNAYAASGGSYANVLVDEGFDVESGAIALDFPDEVETKDLATSEQTAVTRFDPNRRIIYVLAPTSAVTNPQLMQKIMQSSVNGMALPSGFSGGNHTISFTVEDAFENVLRSPNPDSRLIIVNGYAIGTGLTESWVDQNYPEMASRMTFIYFKE